jgi:tripartite-type tricarboxylate transporter receptor subunit TctC
MSCNYRVGIFCGWLRAPRCRPCRARRAQSYPARPIRLIVGFAAGTASDVIGRLFANGAGPVVGQQIVVENKPGAGSSIAAQYVARWSDVMSAAGLKS